MLPCLISQTKRCGSTMRNSTTGILSTAGSCRTLSNAAGFGDVQKRGAIRQEARKGIAKVNIHWGSSELKSTFVFPSSPSPQPLPNGREVILCSCRVCSEFVLWGYNFWSLSFFPLCLSTLSPGFFSPPPADVKVDYKVIQLEKLPGNETNNCFLHKISKFWVGFLGLQSHPGDYVQLSPTAGYSSSLRVCFSDHQWVVAEDKFPSVWCYSWGFRGVPTQNFNCHKHLEICGTERNEPIWQTTLIAPK